jgi:hypothetical protein
LRIQILALESNKKIQKLESQLEEERQLNYSFDTATNNRQNINSQEATFTEESQNINQQQTIIRRCIKRIIKLSFFF